MLSFRGFVAKTINELGGLGVLLSSPVICKLHKLDHLPVKKSLRLILLTCTSSLKCTCLTERTIVVQVRNSHTRLQSLRGKKLQNDDSGCFAQVVILCSLPQRQRVRHEHPLILHFTKCHVRHKRVKSVIPNPRGVPPPLHGKCGEISKRLMSFNEEKNQTNLNTTLRVCVTEQAVNFTT